MNEGRWRPLAIGLALAGVAFVLAWLYLAPGPTDPTRTPRPADGPGPARAVRGEPGAPVAPGGPVGDGGGGPALASRGRASSAGGGTVAGAGEVAPPAEAVDEPGEAAAFVETQVFELLAAVAPEVDARAFARECAPDGRRCTFEGPWPGDDFFDRWVRAIASGRTGVEAMEGVTLSRFERAEDEQGAPRLVLEAHLP